MSTRAQLLLGADFEGDEAFCETVVNALKNHFRMSDPCANMTEKVPGEIASDADDDKLYHIIGESGYPCEEILQETLSADKVPIFASVELGNNHIRTDSRARIYLSGNQLNLVDTTYTKILLDATTFDGSGGGGLVDLGNNKLTVLVSGYYLIYGEITFTDMVADKRYLTAIYVNGASVALKGLQSSIASPLAVGLPDIRYIPAGQDVELYGWNNSGGNTIDVVGDEKQSYLTLHLLSQ